MFSKKLFLIFILFLVFVSFFLFFHKSDKIMGVEMGGKTFSMEVTKTKAELEKGLSGHTPLLKDQGMLFIFSKPDKYGFWMKGMLFPIDIIWIDENFKIVHIENSVYPATYPKIFYPDSQALYVLEVSSGQTYTLNLRMGDTVKFIRK